MTRFEEGDFPALVTMRAISLEEMSSVSLMNMTDTKFLTKADTLALILRDAGDAGYRVCCINGKTADLGPLVIIELKQDGTRHSVFRDILLKHRVFPYRVSKYCVAVTLTDPQARYGRFKEKIRHIEKMIERKLL